MSTAVDHYLSQFEQIAPQLPGAGLDWMARTRRDARDSFASLGFPTPRLEDWKYTRVAPIEKRSFRPYQGKGVGLGVDGLDGFEWQDLESHRLAFVNGRYSSTLSALGKLPKGVTVTSLAEAIDREPEVLEAHLARYADPRGQAFAALNTAFLCDGAFVRLARGVKLDEPLHLVFLSTPQQYDLCSQPRVLVVGEEDTRLVVIESYGGIGESAYLTNALTELSLAEGASVEHYKIQRESAKAFHIATVEAHQSRDSRFVSHAVSLGASISRNDINVRLDAEGADCELNGLYLGKGRQHTDFHTRIDHEKPHGSSREFYKGILTGHARGVFDGRVYVHPDAQKTDAQQSNSNLLLSRDAEVDTKPQLEIYADDVKCSHGATVGQLDENMVFYLRSRGIEERAARGLLTYGFARDVLERMSIGAVRDQLAELILSWLPNTEEIKEIVS